MTATAHKAIYDLLTAEDDGRTCRDIPEEACREQPQNFLKHVISLGATKTGDGLADPKLVLSWLLGTLGAPAYLIGLLVPVREAGALLPQLVIAGAIRSLPRRKWVWAAGSLVQGLCVLGMAGAALTLEGAAAGWTVVLLLAVFACARACCSVSYKDVLGKTVGKATRGTATGTASTVAAAIVLGFGLLLGLGVVETAVGVIAVALAVAGTLWIGASLMFSTLAEAPGATKGGSNPLAVARDQLSLLRDDAQLRRFIATRGFLIATALAPPFMLALGGRSSDGGLGQLGAFVIAAGLASVLSTYVWGRLADVSSRKVLVAAALVGATALGATVAVALVDANLAGSDYVLPALLFVLMIAYQGVRLGRSTHIVDMADEGSRAAYTALSNTIVGALLLLGGLFGLVAEFAGDVAVLAIFTLLCLAAAATGLGLREVQAVDDGAASQPA